MTARPSTAAPLLAGLAILALTGGYVAGYFCLGEWRDLGPTAPGLRQITFRIYGSQWQARLFQPASVVEGVLTGRIVRIGVTG